MTNATTLKWKAILKRRANYAARKASPPPPSPSTLLGSWPTGERSEVRVSLDLHEGRSFLNVRAWYRAKGGEWRPTRRGITLAPEAVPSLVAALEEGAEVARASHAKPDPFSGDAGVTESHAPRGGRP